MIERGRIQDLVKVFYQQPFKVFYINSDDGTTFMKPKGLFISLGLTTGMKTLEGLRDVISSTYPETKVKIVEIQSKLVSGGQFLNTITANLNPSPYIISEFPSDSLDMEESCKELKMLREKIKEAQDVDMKLMTSTQKLQELVDKLSFGDGWENHRIVKRGTDYKIFHRVTNYIKRDDLEYRIGIYVE